MAPAYFFLPPYTPELQPAEHLWEVIDEPIISKRMTGFHGWPNIANAN